ncbi:hypothetical protein [Streptomyces sp. NPDC051636]
MTHVTRDRRSSEARSAVSTGHGHANALVAHTLAEGKESPDTGESTAA